MDENFIRYSIKCVHSRFIRSRSLIWFWFYFFSRCCCCFLLFFSFCYQWFSLKWNKVTIKCWGRMKMSILFINPLHFPFLIPSLRFFVFAFLYVSVGRYGRVYIMKYFNWCVSEHIYFYEMGFSLYKNSRWTKKKKKKRRYKSKA